jgi:hypothetical protein
MAAPEFVPVEPLALVRTYESPPRRPDPWCADRPGDIVGRQPQGHGLGVPGPDQGYALKLAEEQFRAKLIHGRVDPDDAIAGCLGVALTRAALFGRAPTVHDLRAAFTIWGFLDVAPDADLVELREQWFAEVSHPHHYLEARRIVDAVADDALRRPLADIERDYTADWRSAIAVEPAVVDD